MKRRELNQRTVEQQGQLMEDKTIAKDRKNYQLTQQRVREDRERSMFQSTFFRFNVKFLLLQAQLIFMC